MDIGHVSTDRSPISVIARKKSTLDAVVKWSLRHQTKIYRVEHGSTIWYIQNGRRMQKRSGTSWAKFGKALFGTFCAAALMANSAAAASTTGGAPLLTFNAPQFLLTANSGTSMGPTSSFDADWVRGEVLLTFTRNGDTYGMGANINGTGNLELFNETATLLIGASAAVDSVAYKPTWLHRDAAWGSQFLAGGSARADGRDPYGRAVRLKDGYLSLPGIEFPLLTSNNAGCGESDHPTSGVSLSRKHVGCVDPNAGDRILARQLDPAAGNLFGSSIILDTVNTPAASMTMENLGLYTFVLYENDGRMAYSVTGTTVSNRRTFSGSSSGKNVPPTFAPLSNSTGLAIQSFNNGFKAQIVQVDGSGVSLIGSSFPVSPMSMKNEDADYQSASIGPYVLTMWDRAGRWHYRLLCTQGTTITALTASTELPTLAGVSRATLRADPEHNRFYLLYEVGEVLYMMRIDLNIGTGTTTATSGLTSGTTTGVTSGITSGFTTGITSGGSRTVPTAPAPASSPPPPPTPTPPPPTPTPPPPTPTPTPSSAPATEGAPPPEKPNPTVPIVLGTLGGITLLGFVVCLGKRRKEVSIEDDFTGSAFATHELTEVDRGPHYASPTGAPPVRDAGYKAAAGAPPAEYGAFKGRPVSDVGYVRASGD